VRGTLDFQVPAASNLQVYTDEARRHSVVLAQTATSFLASSTMMNSQQTSPAPSGTAGWDSSIRSEYRIEVISGENSSLGAGASSEAELSVRVLDANGNPVPNAQVEFSAPTDGPSLVFSNGEQVNANGVASVTVSEANAVVGTYTVGVQANVAGQVVSTSIPQSNVAAGSVISASAGGTVSAGGSSSGSAATSVGGTAAGSATATAGISATTIVVGSIVAGAAVATGVALTRKETPATEPPPSVSPSQP
jgi:hypothetical protein